MRKQQLARLGLVLALAGSAVACGSDSGNDNGGVTSHVGESNSTTIKDGESAALIQGAATLNIPAGALPVGSTVEVEVKDKKSYGDAANVALDVYDFQVTPALPRFDQPVTLSFDLKGVKVPEGSEAVVAWWDPNAKAWQTLETTVEGGTAKADTTHFTPFTVIFRLSHDQDGNVTGEQTGGQCGDDFQACGGDLTGTWEFTVGCIDADASAIFGKGGSEDPFAMCTDKPTVAFTVDLTGTVTFTADKTFTVNQTITMDGYGLIPNSCIETLGMGMLTCADIDPTATQTDEGCKLPISENGGGAEMETTQDSGTFTLDGNTVLFVDSDGQPDDVASEYCVKGDTLVVRHSIDGQATLQYTATRK